MTVMLNEKNKPLTFYKQADSFGNYRKMCVRMYKVHLCQLYLNEV